MKTLQTFAIPGNALFPNSLLPVILYRQVVASGEAHAGPFLEMFRAHHWTNNRVAGIFTYHHYHSNTHEVLGIAGGRTDVQLGGHGGWVLSLGAGDVLVIPAGVAHRNLGAEDDITCVGGYPGGARYDMNIGKAEERPEADERIRQVPLPAADPVYGPGSEGLLSLWR